MSLLESILHHLFPPRCLVCRATISAQSETLCSSCRKKIIIPDTLFCGRCDARLPRGEKICHRDTPYLLGRIGPYEQKEIKSLVLGLKFKRLRPTAVFLGNLLFVYTKNITPPPPILSDPNTLIIPIPLSQERERERGFNQATEIATVFSHNINLPLSTTILFRKKHAPPQSHLSSRADREENVADVFAVQNPEELLGKNIILIDDVTTTGATLKSAAQLLKHHGVKHILALTIAR